MVTWDGIHLDMKYIGNILKGFKTGFWTLWDIIYANLIILATPVRIIGHQVVSLGHLGGFVAF